MVLGWLVTTYTVVADVLAALDETLSGVGAGMNVEALLTAIAIAIVTALYYWIARQLGRRWPQVEQWLLGSATIPDYGPSRDEIRYMMKHAKAEGN